MPAAAERLWAVLLVVLLAAAPGAGRAEDVDAGTVPSAAQAWRHTEQLDLRHWMDSYHWVGAINGSNGRIDPALCRQHATQLGQALADNPASFALLGASFDCALATGATAQADRASARLVALAGAELNARPLGEDDATVRIGMPVDAFSLVRRSGLRLEYAWYDVFAHRQFVPLRVVAWDEHAQRERWLNFDFSETAARIGERANAGLPVTRMAMARGLLKATARDPATIAAGALRTLQARNGATTPSAMVTAMAPLAREGHYEAIYALGVLCSMDDRLGCGHQAVDALLPLAERHLAQPMLILAAAYAHGSGVAADRQAALQLLRAADARLGEGRGWLWYARHLLRTDQPGLIDGDVLAQLRQLADRGNPDAVVYLQATRVMARRAPTDTDRAALLHAAQRGYPQAMVLYADSIYLSQPAQAHAWWLKAAASGESSAELALARQALRSIDTPGHQEQARAWYRRAAGHGNLDAVRYLVYWHRFIDPAHDHLLQAQQWLRSGLVLGDPDALQMLASLYLTGAPGLAGTPQHGLKLLRELAAAPAGAAARRELASALSYSAVVPHDFTQARRLLTQDAVHGDLASQTALGMLLLYPGNPERDAHGGMTMLRAAASKGQVSAMDALGTAYSTGSAGQRDMQRALRWWRTAARRGDFAANNQLAWWLCTSPQTSVRDPAEGMRHAHWLETHTELSPARRDTVAACYAAEGQFERALAIEQRALLDLLGQAGESAPAVPAFRARIAQYRLGHSYIDASVAGRGAD